MPSRAVIAYLAGAMDSDGFFTIKKSSYHMRVRGDAGQHTYSERVGLKQVTPDIPRLLQATFGGGLARNKPGSSNGKPLWAWHATDKIAAAACEALLPYLRVKRAQAEVVLELRKSKGKGYWQQAYWFAAEYPDWQAMDLMTYQEAAEMLGYRRCVDVGQAIRNGTLLALPWIRGQQDQPRIPRLLVESVRRSQQLTRSGRHARCPESLIAWRERLYQTVRELNRIGVNGTPIYHRTGPYTPAQSIKRSPSLFSRSGPSIPSAHNI